MLGYSYREFWAMSLREIAAQVQIWDNEHSPGGAKKTNIDEDGVVF